MMKIIKRVCKYCKTENEEDFVRKSGRYMGKTVCTKCLINNSTGENSHLKGKPRSLESRRKQSESIMGENNHRFGVSHTQEVKDAHSKRMKGENHPFFGKKATPEHCFNMSITQIFTLKDYQEKYPWFSLFEEMRDLPKEEWEIGKAAVQVKCKKCEDWYTPLTSKIHNRINALEVGKDYSYFYCSNECKHSCSLFGLNVNYYLNNINRLDNEPIHSTPEYQIFRKEVFNQQLDTEDTQTNHCELCNSTENLHIHHEHPIKTHPHLALDPDNGIILCGSCHRNIGHKDECSTGKLAQKICTPIINKEE